MKKNLFLLGLSSLLLASCGGETETTQEENATPEETPQACTYSYNPEETVLTWTAFKLTDKVAVSGTFNEINVEANDGSEDLLGTLNGAKFSIPVNSVNSQDEVRDPKIKNSFFGVMTNPEFIEGKVQTLNETTGSIEIIMNGVAVTYEGDMRIKGEEITWTSTIDMVDFDAQMAVDSLGVVCEEKHTGPDGVNKLWTEVDIAVKTTLTKTCE